MARFRGYCDNIELQSADKLMTHKADSGRVVIIEYEVHGTILGYAGPVFASLLFPKDLF